MLGIQQSGGKCDPCCRPSDILMEETSHTGPMQRLLFAEIQPCTPGGALDPGSRDIGSLALVLFLLALWTEKGSLDVCKPIASPMVSRSLPHYHLLGQVVNDFLV